jgi:hypothetical protein
MKTQEQTHREVACWATTIFLICGFPFYIVIGFTALTSYLTDKSLSEFMQIVALPAAMLGLVAAVAILMALDKLFRKEQETLQLQR